MVWQALTDFENDYEIEVETPHRIRKRSNKRIVSQYVNNSTGYVCVYLNGRNYLYHRILARHFIPNPNNLPQVDHIDRNPLNNSIENLRWVSASENNRNRTMRPYGRYEYLNTAPNDVTEITIFNDVEYPANKYYFCFENDRVVMRINDHKWQLLAQTPQSGYLRINMKDINGRNHQICMHKLIRHFRNEAQNDENVDE